jgi:hypothetical protein
VLTRLDHLVGGLHGSNWTGRFSRNWVIPSFTS